jgi:hypothetical protein
MLEKAGRRLGVARAGVPVIAISVEAMAGDDRSCLAPDTNHYVTRSIDWAAAEHHRPLERPGDLNVVGTFTFALAANTRSG